MKERTVRFCVAASVLLLSDCGPSGSPPTSGGKDCAPKGLDPQPKREQNAIVGWRGDRTGKYAGPAPIEWAANKNVKWSAPMEKSYSSPVVVGDKVFACAEENVLHCLDRKTGRTLWSKATTMEDLPPAQRPKRPRPPLSSGSTTPTPISDGEFVYVCFVEGIVRCFDLEGASRWIVRFDYTQFEEYGRCASPLLVAEKLIVHITRLIALDPKTGKEIWNNSDALPKYGSPIVAKADDVEVIVTPGGHVVRVSDGKTLADHVGFLKYATPLFENGVVYFLDYEPKAVKLSMKGPDEVVAKNLWPDNLELDDADYFSSPVYDNGLIYAVSNSGEFHVIEAASGKIAYRKKLELSPAGRKSVTDVNFYASIFIAGKLLYLMNDQGDTFVLQPGRNYVEVKRNSLPRGYGSTPVVDKSELFIRGIAALYCISD